MNERDAMKLLAEANPVQERDLRPLDVPDRFTRRVPNRRLSLAIAIAAVAVASLAGVFAFNGSGSGQGRSSNGNPRGFGGLGRIGPTGAIGAIGPSGAIGPTGPTGPIPLADASAALGAAVVLPDIPPIDPADIGTVTESCDGAPGRPCEVRVRFPAQGVFIMYDPRWYESGLPVAQYEATAEQNPGDRVVYLGGTPAYGNSESLQFQLNGIFIFIWADPSVHADRPTVKAIAQSIVDRSPPQPPIAAGPTTAPTKVDGAAAAQKLLPFQAVLPSQAAPTSLAVLEPSHQLMAFFNTSATGPYELVEGPSDETVAMLEETAKQWTVGPIHEIDVIDGVEVLLQGSSDGSLTASWLRSDSGSTILTWIQGPETAEQGQVDGTFTKQQAISIASDVIAQGG